MGKVLTIEVKEAIYNARQAGYAAHFIRDDYGISFREVEKVHREYQEFIDDPKNSISLYRYDYDNGQMEEYKILKWKYISGHSVVFWREETFGEAYRLIKYCPQGDSGALYGYETRKQALREAFVVVGDRLTKNTRIFNSIKKALK